jgi:acetoin utilization deacetylase AcuC-like enzyme
LSTLYLTHSDCLGHATPPGHPERADRLRAIARYLDQPDYAGLVREEAPTGETEAILRVHPRSYVDRILEAVPAQGLSSIDPDTVLSSGSLPAISRAVGGAVRAVDAVMTREMRNAFVATRPPGHHAELALAMGFCFFNNAAIAARHAQKVHGAERVAIIDWDVHHGNGTQAIFWNDPSVMYCSTHEMPLFPGTGAASDTGEHGNIVNVPLDAGDGSDAFRDAFRIGILPKLQEFRPDLVIISAGFDAHYRDPLADINLTEADFVWATLELMDIADAHAGGRLVSVLEGGYDLQGLGASAAAHVKALMQG